VTAASKAARSTVLVWVGVVTSVIAELPVWLELTRRPALLATPRYAAWLILLLGFLAAFVIATRHRPDAPRRWPLPLLAVQSLCAIGSSLLVYNSLSAVPFVIVASQLPEVLGAVPALLWIGAQTAAFTAALIAGAGAVNGLILGTVFSGFQLFAFYTFRIAESEREARASLEQAHESLLATRRLLAESTRAAERLRIARELHDVLGHHLTALSLHLEAALHDPNTPDGLARQRVATAQELAKGLLREVREVVSTLRQDESESGGPGGELRLAAALAALSAGVEEPQVHLIVQPEAGLGDPDVTHAVLRCAQELFTNALRHARARNLYIEVAAGDVEGEYGGGITLQARDDGHGAAEVVPGHGLRGMRERIEKLGGHLEIESAPGEGFAVTAWIPRQEETAS
jgi:signal transduction histidine kinase